MKREFGERCFADEPGSHDEPEELCGPQVRAVDFTSQHSHGVLDGFAVVGDIDNSRRAVVLAIEVGVALGTDRAAVYPHPAIQTLPNHSISRARTDESSSAHPGYHGAGQPGVACMAVNELFDEWTTYEKVVGGDYMHHRRYFGAVSVFLASRFDRPLRMLDLGCGDATPVLPLFDHIDVDSYTGVDPSAPALERARANLARYSIDATFLDCTMEEITDRFTGPFDVILASFALHHLPQSNKQELLQSCFSLLATDGIVAIIDVFRDGTESREQWLDRWEADARERFVALEPHEIERLVSHVRDNDLPETMAGLGEIARAAGFANAECLAMGPERLNGALVLEGAREAT